jgi:hypothetical protein
MVVVLREVRSYVLGWETVIKDIMSSLDIERFFDFGVGCNEEMEEDKRRDGEVDNDI